MREHNRDGIWWVITFYPVMKHSSSRVTEACRSVPACTEAVLMASFPHGDPNNAPHCRRRAFEVFSFLMCHLSAKPNWYTARPQLSFIPLLKKFYLPPEKLLLFWVVGSLSGDLVGRSVYSSVKWTAESYPEELEHCSAYVWCFILNMDKVLLHLLIFSPIFTIFTILTYGTTLLLL